MYKQKKLKNGLKLIMAPMIGTKTITVLVIIGTGSKYESRENNGISHFLEHMFFKGTKKRKNTLAIASEMDKIGGEYNAFTLKEFTGYWAKVDFSKMNLAIDIISDMLLNSKFDKKEIEREKGTIIEEINMYDDNPMMHIEDVFEQCLYGDTPAGWDTLGTKKNILKFKRTDFINYLRSQYGIDNTYVCLAGNIKPGAEKIVNKFFHNFKKTNFKDKESVLEKQDAPKINLCYKKTNQATLSLGFRAFPIGHKDEFILKVLSIILGGSMSSRLFIELRERRGLAYSIRTQTEIYTDTGYLTAQAGVPVEKLEESIKVILNEYKKIKKELVGSIELSRNKGLIQGRSIIQLESSDNMATWFARQAVLRENILTPKEYFNKINKITAKDIKRVANDIFVNNGLNLAVIGPFKDENRFEKILKL